MNIFKCTRLNRMQHFLFQFTVFIAVMILCFAAAFIDHKFHVDVHDGSLLGNATYILGIFVAISWAIIAMLAHIARLHDCNKSGWWILLIYLLSAIVAIPILLLYVWPGTIGENKYGK